MADWFAPITDIRIGLPALGGADAGCGPDLFKSKNMYRTTQTRYFQFDLSWTS